MANPKAVLEAVTSLDELLDALDGLIDKQFSRDCQIEFTNGEVDAKGHIDPPGIPYFFCAYENVKHDDDAPYLTIDEGSGRSRTLTPPDYDQHVEPGDGFVVGCGTTLLYGANLMVPIVLCPLWLDAPANMTVTSPLKVPAAVAAKFSNPMPWFVWIVIGGIYGPPVGPAKTRTAAMSMVSYFMHPQNYPPNAKTPTTIQTMLDTVWDQVANNNSAASQDGDEIGPESYLIKTLGVGEDIHLTDAGYRGVTDSRGLQCFLDDDGNLCRPKLLVTCTLLGHTSYIRCVVTNKAAV